MISPAIFSCLVLAFILTAAVQGEDLSGKDPLKPLPRISVKNGFFIADNAAARFIPRGFNYIRLSPSIWHDTFNPKTYDHDRADAALADMQASGFNITRVFLDQSAGTGIVTDREATELSAAYMEPLCDFLAMATRHGIHVILTPLFTPDSKHYRPSQSDAKHPAGINEQTLQPTGIHAKAQYIAAVCAGIKMRNPMLLPAVFSYELDNETYVDLASPPFSDHGGEFAFDGKSYAMNSSEQIQALIDRATVAAVDAAVVAVRTVDPDAMVSVNVFTFKAVGRTGPGHACEDSTGDKRHPARPLAVAQSKASYLDIHFYVGSMADLDKDLISIEWPQVSDACKKKGLPVIMGEFGAIKPLVPAFEPAPKLMADQARRMLELGFQGFLYWTYDNDEQNDILWHAKWNKGEIFHALCAVTLVDDTLEPAK